MARVLSYPFRFVNGAAATVEQGSDAAVADLLLAVVITQRGERVLVPTFGITSPVFGRFAPAELRACVALHGPPVNVLGVETKIDESGQLQLTVAF